jgi:hypothetical protein
MSVRLLAIITPGEEATALGSMAGLVTIARAAGSDVRLAYFRALPPPRLDRHDRLVADTDREMARITAQATQSLDTAARVFDDVNTETVVRFGKPQREAVLEAETYRPAIIVHFSALRSWLARLRGWALRRQLAGGPQARVLVLRPTPRPSGSAGPVLEPVFTPPAPLPARRE